MTYRLTYFPRDAGLSPRPGDIRTRDLFATNARHAARLAASYERRTGARVLTVKEKSP